MRRLILAAFLSLSFAAAARPVAIGGVPLNPRIETKTLPSGAEGLPVWFLARLGVDVLNQPSDIRLKYGDREFRFTPSGGWGGADLPQPELLNSSVHVSLYVLRALGVPVLTDSPEMLDFAAPTPKASPVAPQPPVTAAQPTPPPVVATPPVAAAPALQVPAAPLQPAPAIPVPSVPLPSAPLLPAPPSTPAPFTPTTPPAAQLAGIRSSRTIKRAQETQRVVLEFAAPATFQLSHDARGVTLLVSAASVLPASQKLESGDTLTLTPGSGGTTVRLETGVGGTSSVFTLHDPYRIVIDTVTNLDPTVTPPPDLDKLPAGVTHRQFGKLQLLSFNPAHFTPKVVSAGTGAASSVYDLVKRAGGVAGVNGGYFDPKTSYPVDLVALGGLMLSPSLERRATLGFTQGDGVLFGFPRPRYTLAGSWGLLTVNTVRPQPHAKWVTLFVGDGRTPVGGPGYTTLTLNGAAVTRAQFTRSVPAPGEITVTFDPQQYPQLPTQAGVPLQLNLNWADANWNGVREALAAGPLLVDGGRYALDAVREGFDTRTNVWRPTRQVAFAVYAGQPTIAYFENGTPEEFARALVGVGASSAMRLDSGSSATVYVAGGYFNTVWSRPVPNAIVFVPKASEVAGAGK